ncbi:MAG TPA: hypothetical protein VH255_09640 [Verrucomicrobiae bacterium]|nr:hypothetical protein [Verrucomicrobiae bacterium]
MNTNISINVLRKTRSDASWNKLTKEQRELLEQWLFEEGLGYDEAFAKAKSELGFEGSVHGVKRFYKRMAQERLLEEMLEASEEAKEICGASVDISLLSEASRKVLGQRFFQRLREQEVEDTTELGKLWVQAEANELRRQRLEVQKAAQEVRRQRLEFEQQRWQYEVTEEAEGILEEIMAFEQEREADRKAAADPYRFNKRTNKIRRALFQFGTVGELLPESAEEEAAMEGEKARKCG